MNGRPARARAAALAAALLVPAAADAHSGPPYPVLSDQVAGAYQVSVWSDPDATDDGTAEGKFWVVLRSADGSSDVPSGTRVTVTIAPLDGSGPELSAPAAPVDGSIRRQYAALVMDHEGRFAVRAAVDGPWGPAQVDAHVDATYDLRPSPLVVGVYLLPFLALGAIWVRVFYARRTRHDRRCGLGERLHRRGRRTPSVHRSS